MTKLYLGLTNIRVAFYEEMKGSANKGILHHYPTSLAGLLAILVDLLASLSFPGHGLETAESAAGYNRECGNA